MAGYMPTRNFTPEQRAAMDRLTSGLPTKSAKIRALDAAGHSRAEIAAYLRTSYQHVRGVLGATQQDPVHVGESEPVYGDASGRIWGVVRVGPQGEIRLPPEVLSGLDARVGRSLAWSMDGRALKLMSAEDGLEFVVQLAVDFTTDEDLLSEQLLQERRAETAREEMKDRLMYG